MKTLQSIFLITCISLVLFAETSAAQDQIAVPLSNPGQPGQLNLSLIRGSINITGYDGNEVVIRHNGQQADLRDRDETRDGMRRLTGSSRGFEVQERNNSVSISGVSPIDHIDFEIHVPYNFSLKLSLVNGATLHVERVDGTLEISNVNGGITLAEVGGSALLNTVNGDIKATFRSVADDKPMAFSNVNGDIDITLPEGARFSAKMKTEMGDVFTDFDLDVESNNESNTQTGGSGGFKISVNKWILATANGGGPEFLFKTLRGDILVRKQ